MFQFNPRSPRCGGGCLDLSATYYSYTLLAHESERGVEEDATRLKIVVGFLVGLESRIGTIDPLLRPRTVGGPSRPRPGSFLGFVDTVRAMTLRVALQG